ncbi:tripartite tricarboxylate transporter substrate-binding protein [Bradyrhizobium sp. LHD-71]|uniref:Bug family tripartite tricarboxylate transporter substrate binding protein n=1 Tax=Bradyrhizobium sp. LHD-71 TaxID=3072141 RepID=UPI00280EEBE6|nr:tripartite tricarboxylate transporter substrate-binding protein [Bradyrhizobium sp. LHD-71]MDQ8731047.1 tripartite tricarboxylate transporter substrate-binding protein [Bradyrhizobium sp. LHD-71]
MCRLMRACALLLAVLAASDAGAQEWPARFIKMIVPGSPGSAPDVMARFIADRLTQVWGQQVIVENQPGAGGNIGVAAAARAAPDGYTLLFSQATPLTLNQHLFKQIPYDVEKDFDPVTFVGDGPMLIAASPKLGVRSIKELIAKAKTSHGRLSYATPGVKDVPHLTGELLKSMTGIEMQHVSYRANTQAVTDTMTGVVDLVVDGVPALLPQVNAGNLVALGVTSERKLPGLEALPLVNETLPGFAISGWFAVLAPKGVSSTILQRVNKDVQAALEIEDLVTRMKDLGVYVDRSNTTPQHLVGYMRAQSEMFGNIVQSAKLERD